MLGDDFYILFFSFLVNSSEFQSHFGLVQPEVKMELGGPTPPRTPSPTFQSQGNCLLSKNIIVLKIRENVGDDFSASG